MQHEGDRGFQSICLESACRDRTRDAQQQPLLPLSRRLHALPSCAADVAGSIPARQPFLFRLVDAIQMTNDERVHTKENYSRTCTAVGTRSLVFRSRSERPAFECLRRQ